MSSAPFPASAVIARLQDSCPGFQMIEGAAEYAAITSLAGFRPDSAFVLLARESSAGDKLRGGRQAIQVTFGVVIAVSNYRDKLGGEAMGDISPLIGQSRAALMGWIPPVNGGRGCEFIQGDVLDFDNSMLLWSDVYQTQHFIGVTP